MALVFAYTGHYHGHVETIEEDSNHFWSENQETLSTGTHSTDIAPYNVGSEDHRFDARIFYGPTRR